MPTLLQKIAVHYHYPVVFTRNLFHPDNHALKKCLSQAKGNTKHRCLIYLDDQVARGHPQLVRKIQKYFTVHQKDLELSSPPILVPGGEAIKNRFPQVLKIMNGMISKNFCRHSYVLAIGGGAVLDAIGFAAALVHRGLRLVRIPTTVLAQNDAGVGVKNGLNYAGKKNLIGTFSPPHAVLNDFQFLTSLPLQAWTSGIAEAFKVAIIQDRRFFGYLCAHASRLQARDEGAMEYLVRHCAALHLKHIRTGGDPFEMGNARPLDFGHWCAHKLETMSKHSLTHGEAVAIGIALDSAYARLKNWLTEKEFLRIHHHLILSGFKLWTPLLSRCKRDGKPEVLDGLLDFQEHLGGQLCITFPKGVGAKQEVHSIDLELMVQSLKRLKSLSAQA